MPDAPLEKFQKLLRELFQFDCQGLDFGIYRVLNLKRGEIEKFIGERLPQIIDEAFTEYAAADQQEVQRELGEKRKEIEETAAKLGQQAFEPSGQLVLAIRETPLGKQFIELETKAKAGRVADDLKAGVYNDLYAFFSRYYDDGDIFSKPRRGRVEIPFTGHEDVVLYL
jgi:adenine-specific DNA-methyltransferase